MGVYPAELPYRVRARGALRSLQRVTSSNRNLLRRESCRDRADSPLMLSAREAWHGGLAAVGDLGCLFPGDGCSSSCSGGAVCSFGAYRRPVLRLTLSPASCGSFGDRCGKRSSWGGKDYRLPDTGQAPTLLLESWVVDLR